jgi:hypothetical protein
LISVRKEWNNSKQQNGDELLFQPMMNPSKAMRFVIAAFAVTVAMVCGPVLSVKLGAVRALLMVSTFAGGVYLVGTWIMVDHPAELKRKIPISSKELRRRRKRFYDWLASQGRVRKG